MVDSLNKYIICVENVVPHDLCDAILEEYGNNAEWAKARVGADGRIDTEVRNLSGINISDNDTKIKNPEIRNNLDSALFQSAGRAIQGYQEVFQNCSIDEDTGYHLLRYETGEFYKEHVDHYKASPRVVSCSFSLNNEYEGGEFSFFNNELKVRVDKGSAIMFPSNFMYPHQILPVTSGVRYSIVTWFR
jgi:predicted 2-oxoglutarate/Fe(II)-dependent dioxygenase YbiX